MEIVLTDFRSKCRIRISRRILIYIQEGRCLLRFIEYLKRKMIKESIRYARTCKYLHCQILHKVVEQTRFDDHGSVMP